MVGPLTTDEVETFLEELSSSCAESTVRLYRLTCMQFQKWSEEHVDSSEELCVKHLQDFLEDHRSEWKEATLKVKSSVLRNLLLSKSGMRVSAVRAFDPYSRTDREDEVGSLLSYLREYRYGSRAHIIVELIYSSECRPTYIRKINVGHVDFDSNRIEIPRPKVAVDTSVEYQMPAELADALDHHIKHERHTTADTKQDPLITTVHGRASLATLRRSVLKASDESPEVSGRITPRTVRSAALKQNN